MISECCKSLDFHPCRKKLAPETFDKVVARANLELRIENRPPATSTMGTRSHIFLG